MDSDSLTITDVTENDAGTYTCIMVTTLDQDSASAELTVVGMFPLSYEQPPHAIVNPSLKYKCNWVFTFLEVSQHFC